MAHVSLLALRDFSLLPMRCTDPEGGCRYWVVFAFLNLLESAFLVTYWIPFYYIFKFALIMWLGLPQFRHVMFATLSAWPF